MEGLSIREVADKTGITAHTLRYYERIGLVQPITRARSGHRRYGEDDVRWLELLKKLHQTGMPIKRMLEYARLARRGDTTVMARRTLLDDHKKDIEDKLEKLQSTLALITKKIRLYDAALAQRKAG